MADELEGQAGEGSEGIQALMAKLPPHIRDFIYSPEMEAIIATIGQKNALHIDQIGALEAEAAAAMTGLTATEDLEDNIATALELEPQKAAAVTKDVNEMLFIKIREGMKASSEPKRNTEQPKAPTAVQTPPPPVSTPQVVMPSSKPATPTPPIVSASGIPAVAPTPAPASAPAPTPAPAAHPAPALNLAAADAALSEKKVTPPPTVPVAPVPAAQAAAPEAPKAATAPKPDPVQPQPYKADPYREPVE